jgi:hypothetical protein
MRKRGRLQYSGRETTNGSCGVACGVRVVVSGCVVVAIVVHAARYDGVFPFRVIERVGSLIHIHVLAATCCQRRYIFGCLLDSVPLLRHTHIN